MSETNLQIETPQWLILLGGSCCILLLGVSAFWEADIRWLHFFQAWMYIAAIALDMALFQPRYLSIFPRLLHPHLL